MRALVIGGTGFIGQAACKELMRRGVETVAASPTAHPYGTFTSHRVVDRSDPGGLERMIAQVMPDVVLDLAGAPPEPLAGVTRTVFVTCRKVTAREGTTVLATPAVMGPSDPSLRIAEVIDSVQAGAKLAIPGSWSGRPLGLSWVRDVGFACALACDLRRPLDGRAFELGFDHLTLEDLLKAIGRATGSMPELEWDEEAAWPYQPADLDLEPARRDLGFEPSAIEDALAETLAWHRVRRLTQRHADG